MLDISRVKELLLWSNRPIHTNFKEIPISPKDTTIGYKSGYRGDMLVALN